MILVLAVGIVLAVGGPYPVVTVVQADPGSGHGCGHHEGCGPGCPGCGCESGCPKGAAQVVPPCMQDNAAAAPGGMPRRMWGGGGGPQMRKAMAMHLEEMRATVKKLRALEEKMEILKSKDDAAAFRAASLEHSKLLTDLQESHLKHVEGMVGAK